MSPPLLSVLIVNFNGRRHLGPCLAALAAQTLPRHQFEIVIVDNASIDGSLAFIQSDYPWVRIVSLDQNTGFAGGNNAGLPMCRGRYVALLNNDTMPDPHWLAELAQAIQPGAAIASKLVFATDPGRLNSAGLQLLRDGRAVDRGFLHLDHGQFEQPERVFAGCGAALLIDTHTLRGPLFDSRYFVYYEDLDAFWRAELTGQQTNYAPRSLVRHVHGGSAGDGSPLFRYHVERNRALTSLRNADLFLAVWNGVGLAARVVRAGFRWLRGRERGVLVRATAAALGSFLVMAPAIIIERYVTRTGAKCGF